MPAEGVLVDTASLETVVCFLLVFECSATGVVRMTKSQSTLFNPDDLSFLHPFLFLSSFSLFLKQPLITLPDSTLSCKKEMKLNL